MIVTSSSPEKATKTELLVLRGLGRGRRIFWRSLETNIVLHQGRNLVQRKIETKEFTTNKIITRTENYYFDRINISTSAQGKNNRQTVHTDPLLGISFPNEISWLHFGDFHEYEKRDPELGYSLGYHAPGFKSHIYVYPTDGRKPAYKNELESAIREVMTVYGPDAIEHDWGITELEDYSYYFFKPKYEPNSLSGIMVTMAKGHFIKVRMTFHDEPTLRKMSRSFFVEILNLVRGSH